MLLAAVLSAWLQYASDGRPHVRAVVTGAACPAVHIDGHSEPMSERAPKSATFPDIVCDAVISTEARQARLDDRQLPAPVRRARTIVVLGDTGCRLSRSYTQSCNDPEGWQFPRIARAIAAVHPDLVVHVGDYLYREAACTVLARCADSPYGDDAAAWYADFLTPAAPIFSSAPLLLTRGNHEECRRNGTGWFRYFDAHPGATCREFTEPFAIDAGDLRLVDFDSAAAAERSEDPARSTVYRHYFAVARELVRGQSWFVTHRPPYTNVEERGAMGVSLVPFDAVLAGHIHFFAALDVEGHPPLIVNGEGGAPLDPNYAPLLRLAMGDLRVQGDVFGVSRYGFGVYTRMNAGWSISLRETDGTERATCTLAQRAVHCRSGD